jgi:hypothetical protein
MSSAIASGGGSSLTSPSSAIGEDRLFIWNNRLTKLVEEFHRESIATGGDANNPRVAEVRRRIAELVREEGDNSGASGRRPSPIVETRSEMRSVAPPAYELG